MVSKGLFAGVVAGASTTLSTGRETMIVGLKNGRRSRIALLRKADGQELHQAYRGLKLNLTVDGKSSTELIVNYRVRGM